MSSYGQFGMTVTPAGTWEPYRLDSARGYGEALMPGEKALDMDAVMDDVPIIVDIGPNASNMQKQYGTEDSNHELSEPVEGARRQKVWAVALAAGVVGAVAGGAAVPRKGKAVGAAAGAAAGIPLGYLVASSVWKKPKKLGRFGDTAPKINPPTTDNWWAKVPWPVKLTFLLAGPVAIGMSYAKNKSVGWAILHGFVALPYIAYRVASGDVKARGKRRR